MSVTFLPDGAKARLAFYLTGKARTTLDGRHVGYRADGVRYEDWRDGALDALRQLDPEASRRDAETLIREVAQRWPQAFGFNPWYAVHNYRKFRAPS